MKIYLCSIKNKIYVSRIWSKTYSYLIKAGLIVNILFTLLPSGAAAIYYVSPFGSNTNSGSLSSPWLTIQKAANMMEPGDTTIVGNGIYPERVFTKKSGTSDLSITYRAESTNAIVWSFYVTNMWQNIEGFTITGTNAGAYEGSITTIKGGHHLTIKSNVFASSPPTVWQVCSYHDPLPLSSNMTIIGNQFINGKHHALGLLNSGHLVEGNLFTGTNGWDIIRANAANTIIRGNIFTNCSNLISNSNHADLIQAFAYSTNDYYRTNVIVEANIGINCKNAQIGDFDDPSRGDLVADWTWRNNIYVNVDGAMNIFTPKFRFFNNTFVDCARNTGSTLLFRVSTNKGNAHGGMVFNNIFYRCGDTPSSTTKGWYAVYPGITNFQSDYNLVIGTSAGITKNGFQTGSREIYGINGVDPRFQNIEKLDFRLQSNSPCIRAGLSLNQLFSNDASGLLRGTSWDIGAFQYQRERPISPRLKDP